MAKIDWLVICERTVRDREGFVSLMKLLTTQWVKSVPLTAPLSVAFQISGGVDESYVWSMKMTDPKGRDITPEAVRRVNVDLVNHMAQVAHVDFQGFEVTDFGEYRFLVTLNDRETATVSLHVLPQQAAQKRAIH